ncbi:MAG: amidase family protein [Gammaproteobacteria bacterium]
MSRTCARRAPSFTPSPRPHPPACRPSAARRSRRPTFRTAISRDAAWGGQACNPYDTSRVPRGTSNGSGVSVSANLVTCGICEQTSASCKGPASRNGVVNLLATKGVMMDGGPGYSDSGDRAGVHCRSVADAVKVLDTVKGFNSEDMYTALTPGIIPKDPYASFLVTDASNQPLKGKRIAVVREFMVKHVKNDAAISDQIDGEIKKVLRDQLGAELVESVDPLYPDDPTIPNLKYTFEDAFREILPHNVPEYFWQKTPDGKLEFAVPGWDVTSIDYALALSAGKAPLSDKLNLRRIARNLGNPDGLFQQNKYLMQRGDARITDWAAWVANSKFKTDAQRASSENAIGVKDIRTPPRHGELSQDAGRPAPHHSEGHVRERHRRVRQPRADDAPLQARRSGRAGGEQPRHDELLRGIHRSARRPGARCAGRLHADRVHAAIQAERRRHDLRPGHRHGGVEDAVPDAHQPDGLGRPWQ